MTEVEEHPYNDALNAQVQECGGDQNTCPGRPHHWNTDGSDFTTTPYNEELVRICGGTWENTSPEGTPF